MKTNLTNEIKDIIAEINRLTEANAEITKSGKFFTSEQFANEKKAWALKMNLRFNHGMEIGSY
jgi:23S rRNA pseudoU1915 N3-methylase RlmH